MVASPVFKVPIVGHQRAWYQQSYLFAKLVMQLLYPFGFVHKDPAMPRYRWPVCHFLSGANVPELSSFGLPAGAPKADMFLVLFRLAAVYAQRVPICRQSGRGHSLLRVDGSRKERAQYASCPVCW